MTDPWKNLPKHYTTGRWHFDYDDRNSEFFVHCGGHRILDCEDSEVAHAICAVFNSRPQIGEDRPQEGVAVIAERAQLFALRNSDDFLDLPKMERDRIDRRLDELLPRE